MEASLEEINKVGRLVYSSEPPTSVKEHFEPKLPRGYKKFSQGVVFLKEVITEDTYLGYTSIFSDCVSKLIDLRDSGKLKYVTHLAIVIEGDKRKPWEVIGFRPHSSKGIYNILTLNLQWL